MVISLFFFSSFTSLKTIVFRNSTLVQVYYAFICLQDFFIDFCSLYRKKCKRRSVRKRGDAEAGSVTSPSADQMGKKERNEQKILERKAAGKNKKKSKHTPRSSPGNSNATPPDIQSIESTTGKPTSRAVNKETTAGIPLTPLCTATGTPSADVRINMEDSDSTLPESLSSTSVRSELRSMESNLSPPLAETVNKLTLEDETGLTPVTDQSAPMTDAATKDVMDSLSFPKDSEEQTSPVSMETGVVNSSNESCKTPVAPCSDVMITVEDGDESKSPLLISENESSSAEVIYVRNDSTTDTVKDMDKKNGPGDEASKVPSNNGKPFCMHFSSWSFLQRFFPLRNQKTRILYLCSVNQYLIKVNK